MSLLRDLRIKRKLTQAQLAEILGCKQNTLSELETGAKSPGRDLTARIEEWSDGEITARSWPMAPEARACA